MSDHVLSTKIMHTLLDIIHETHTGLPRNDKSKLGLIEIKPKSARFAKTPLSCSIAPNDPADPNGWVDEEPIYPGQEYNLQKPSVYIEMGTGQPFNYRFTIDFTFFFLNIGIFRDEALEIAEEILTRIHIAIVREGSIRGGKFGQLRTPDKYGQYLVNANRAVKKKHIRPGGDQRKTLYKGKMWLQFEVLIDPKEKPEIG